MRESNYGKTSTVWGRRRSKRSREDKPHAVEKHVSRIASAKRCGQQRYRNQDEGDGIVVESWLRPSLYHGACTDKDYGKKEKHGARKGNGEAVCPAARSKQRVKDMGLECQADDGHEASQHGQVMSRPHRYRADGRPAGKKQKHAGKCMGYGHLRREEQQAGSET